MKGFRFEEIGEEKRDEVARLRLKKSLYSAIEDVLKEGRTPVIAEAKTSSPSNGKISDLEPEDAAEQMQKGGACAISVLTDKHFDGKICHLRRVKEKVDVPVLRKDFIVDRFQLTESSGNGADAVLLIASLLKEKTKDFVEEAKALGMEALVEVHDEADLKFALDSGSKLIGINNRDLKTMKIDLSTTERLAKKIPEGHIIVSESGIKTKEDLARLKKAGAKAFLIGTEIMKAEDIRKKTEEYVR